MQHRKTLMLVLTALFAALTAVGAFFKIPFALAAISLQFLFTAMAGILLGAGYGALSQLVYVLIGLVGVPIFALGGGFSYVLQPTFGFLLGYGEIARETARRMGLPRMSAQAVGGAVGHNSVSLVIPCHRVVGENGSLTGYAGGIEKKIKLLELEGADMTRFFVPEKGSAL